MKNYILTSVLLCFAMFSNSQNNLDRQWKKVAELEQEGLTKSAAQIVDRVYKTAKINHNHQQLIKALLYKSKYMMTLEEEAQLSIVKQFKSEIDSTQSIVTKHLLENMLATMYWQYFQQNRYRFYNRTTTFEKQGDDFRTWDLKTLFNEIHTYYQRSLENGLLLQQEPIGNYKTLITESKGSKDFRPTLYDLLSHNALDFYKTDENSISQPSYKFVIDDENFLKESETFIILDLEAKDSLSLQLNALKIYQNLLRFHVKDKSSIAFVDVDIERLRFVNQNASFKSKIQVLLKTLKTSAAALKPSSLSAIYNFEVASVLAQQGYQFNLVETDNENNIALRWKLKEAYDLCDSVIKEYPKSNGAEKCKILQSQILQPELRLLTEGFVANNKPSKLLVTYKNLEALEISVYKVTKAQLDTYNSTYGNNDQANFFEDLKIYQQFSSALKNEGDFQRHSTEIVLPKLPNGVYLIKAQTKTPNKVFAAAHVQVTDFALVENFEKNRYYYQLINRLDGEPIADANILIEYETNRGKTFSKNLISNSYGKFEFLRDNNYYRRIKIKVNYQNETAYFGDYFISRKFRETDQKDISYNSFVFTNRSIYRPGQTVYFKGIITQTHTKSNKTSIVADETIKATLYNANGEELNEQQFTSNTFGSIQGEFVLPNDGLTGQFYIMLKSDKIGEGSAFFSVEEYKRPKFKASFEPISDTFKVNDSIRVKGKAIAFAGSTITNAKVIYMVKRQIQFPPWYYWRNPYFMSEPQEITFGETKTNSNGEFEILFKALPDQSLAEEELPVFRYEVTADVTDINGETRTAATVVNVGYHAMTINVSAPLQIEKTANKTKLEISAKNLNGETISATGRLKIFKLVPPQEVLRQRPWNAPDYQTMSEEEFKTLFPHEPYTNEHLVTNWKKGKQVFSTSFNTEENSVIIIKRIKKWVSGKYLIEVESTDKFGQEVENKTFTNVISNNDKTVADNALFEARLDKKSYKPGDVAILTVGSAAKDITVTVEIGKDDQIISTQLVKLNNSKQTLSIPILENDLGGFEVYCSFAAFNSFETQGLRINVPFPKKDLTIETKTFRDMLQPGENETWSFTIKGAKGDKVSAELLASMYDASLDEFKSHEWRFNPVRTSASFSNIVKTARNSFGITDFRLFRRFSTPQDYNVQSYDRLNWFGFYFGSSNRYYYAKGVRGQASGIVAMEEDSLEEVVMTTGAPGASEDLENEQADLLMENTIDQSNEGTIQIRKNLQETAFFFPELRTDEEGNVSFSFKAPEALTKWKLQLLAHTQTLESGMTTLEAITQKELMVIPNAPRFLREGDEITISTKIANLTSTPIVGKAELQLKDALSGQSIDALLSNTENSAEFSIEATGNTQVSWTLSIPLSIQAVEYTIIATSDDFSDGEQNTIPVLSNRMLVTETLPMWVKSNETRTFSLDKLKTNTSSTLKHHMLTLEMTSNPAWYAVQALPYLMEYPYDCNEQIFARYYANTLAHHIVKSNPRIEAVFNQWKSHESLLSNLEKNQELKSMLIQETPWLRDAQSETEQKKRIGLLFDLNTMTNALQSTQRKLKNNQLPSGAWSWFNGGRDNRYITQHIIAGFGHLKHLGIQQSSENMAMVQSAFNYLDKAFIKTYEDLRKYDKDVDLTKDHLSYIQLHYLYVRSFYPELKPQKEVQAIIDFYKDQIKRYWLKRSLYAKGLMALTMNRMEQNATATKILKSLEENSITSEELGMYWKENTDSWYWYQAPIETQAILIEAFSEIENDKNIIDNLKIWLLKNKQTNQWKTTKATTEAVYALLLQGSDWLDVTEMVDVKVGSKTISPKTLENVKLEAGTGYYKTSWAGTEITPEMGTVTIDKSGEGIAWGSLYWQYFEDLDKITSAETPLKLSKTLFLKSNTDKGEMIAEITPETTLKVGDLVRVRIELRTDRPMEFVHLKDMRAAGFEPINVLSQYKWQDGLGYYESTKDAATNFFIDYLPKGIYVFEYDLRVNNAGDMSNGISTAQSMYAPEFSSHSEGTRVSVE
ncbi:alpha-2-macroglobulin family protein [Winogradskyella aurantia]|uniref:Alpha-2-macroglobulin n=1 Tax=Winogradskyella aurantia TaxID=1915063 RepID=A0A265UNR2_9FLAO|nr:alpha-2-macroglobulin family protein [Winogradskyella aurantia]OZV66928.1 alpha-2-macroglobulin [Winogradskyella aurantia]